MKKPGTYFTNDGTFHIPNDVLFPGDFQPVLDPKAWLFWILVRAENYPGDSKKYIDGLGSASTIQRIRKHLIFRGFI